MRKMIVKINNRIQFVVHGTISVLSCQYRFYSNEIFITGDRYFFYNSGLVICHRWKYHHIWGYFYTPPTYTFMMNKSNMKKLTITVLISMNCLQGYTHSLAINTNGSTAHSSALLDINATGKGLLIPRMDKTQRNAIITPATGLIVFQNAPDSIGFYFYDGNNWLWMATVSTKNGWSTSGNADTDTTTDFIGTTDKNT